MDLFGTLVKGFNRQDYDPVIARMAETFDIPCQDFWDSGAETYPARGLGHYDPFEANLTDMCIRAVQEASIAQVELAASYHYEFMTDAITLEAKVIEKLEGLKIRGLPLGLISDCAPDVPFLSGKLPLARLIDESVFTCEGESRSRPKPYTAPPVDDSRSSLTSVSTLATEAARS
ncbi:MAG: HAD family hydrolase [Dehalococcoidia bacterium]